MTLTFKVIKGIWPFLPVWTDRFHWLTTLTQSLEKKKIIAFFQLIYKFLDQGVTLFIMIGVTHLVGHSPWKFQELWCFLVLFYDGIWENTKSVQII